jgi:hypothetical protein
MSKVVLVLFKDRTDCSIYPATDAKVIASCLSKFYWVGNEPEGPFTECKALKIENGNMPPVYISMENVKAWSLAEMEEKLS